MLLPIAFLTRITTEQKSTVYETSTKLLASPDLFRHGLCHKMAFLHYFLVLIHGSDRPGNSPGPLIASGYNASLCGMWTHFTVNALNTFIAWNQYSLLINILTTTQLTLANFREHSDRPAQGECYLFRFPKKDFLPSGGRCVLWNMWVSHIGTIWTIRG